MSKLTDRAWSLLQEARMDFDDRTVGLRAACDDTQPTLNYDQCFIRDFALCAPALLIRGEVEMVRDFLLTTLSLQSKERALDALKPRRGLMPGSFRPVERDGQTVLEGDYGEESIARVTPVDSMFWWLVTLRAYTRVTGDSALAGREDVQEGIRRILRLALEGSFEMFPTLLVPDGAFMVDRRLGVDGHPLEVQALFFAGLRCAEELLDADHELGGTLRRRMRNLRHHVARYYWMDEERLESLHHMERGQFGEEVVNVFNIFPESIPEWIEDWIPDAAGYLAGNVSPGRIDFRFFMQGNLMAVTTGLCDRDQVGRIERLVEACWSDLVGGPGPRLVFPALEGEDWRILTGADAKNKPWRYHNGGRWPCLLWSFANATVTWGRPDLLERVVEEARQHLEADGWPEYYDGRDGATVGERARRRQSWTIGAFIFAEACLEDPEVAEPYLWREAIAPERVGVREPGETRGGEL